MIEDAKEYSDLVSERDRIPNSPMNGFMWWAVLLIIATAHKIGKRANEWTDTGQSDEIGQDEPNPAINTSDVGINVWRNATCGYRLALMSGDGRAQ
jgi:hypothetical protein